MGDTPKYNYIVVGSGAGGGVVAARLAAADYTVLLLEAGSDPLKLQGSGPLGPDRLPNDYRVPAFHSAMTENDAIKWDIWVRHYGDDTAQEQDPKFYPQALCSKIKNDPDEELGGVLYPRASALGGCTGHSAMIIVPPHESDWDEIAAELGDDSWNAKNMRRYFERMENCHYRFFWRFVYKMFGWNPLRRGFNGWLHTERAPLFSLGLRDFVLAKIIIKSALKAIWEVRQTRGIKWIGELFSRFDPSDVQSGDQAEGVYYVPMSTNRRARCGTREFLRDIEKKHPGKLTIKLNCLATRVIFEDTNCKNGDRRAVGVEYFEGDRLYEACAVQNSADPKSKVKRVSCDGEVILSCGAFNTPQLLMLSGIGPKDQLAKTSVKADDWITLPGVGKNLQDRYEVGVVYRLKDELRVVKGCELRGDDLHGKEWARSRSGVYTTNGAALAIISQSNKERREKKKPPDLFAFALLGKFRGYFPGYCKLPVSKYLTWAILKAHTENDMGTVTLRSSDPRDQPWINFKYFKEGTNQGKSDLIAVVSGIEFVRKLCEPIGDLIATEELPGKQVHGQQALKEWVEARAWGHHACGTCKIGPQTDDQAVVDKDFRVHKTSGLRIVDASVFPRIPGFFLLTPIYMIAEKASDAILANARSRMVKKTSPLTIASGGTMSDMERETHPVAQGAKIIIAGLAALLHLAWQAGRGVVFAVLALVAVLASLALIDPYLAAPPETGKLLSAQLQRLSVLPPWASPVVLILLLFNLLLTLIHSVQELKGRMWDYVGRIAGVRIPDIAGILIFFVFLTIVLWIVGFLGIVGYPPISDPARMFFVGGIIGARISDRWWLHISLNRQGYRPNPGLSSTPWYLAEAIILTVVFLKGIGAYWAYSVLGFLTGWLAFYSVIPIARALANILPRQPQWKPERSLTVRSQSHSTREDELLK